MKLVFNLLNRETVQAGSRAKVAITDCVLHKSHQRFIRWMEEQGKPQIKLAYEVAKRVHQDDFRHTPVNTPYVSHPVGVAWWIIEKARLESPDLVIAALLHDCKEDHPELFSLGEVRSTWGPKVAGILQALTNPEITEEQASSPELRNQIYVEHVVEAIQNDDVLVVKLADFYENAGKLRDLVPVLPQKSKALAAKYITLIPHFQARVKSSVYNRNLAWLDKDLAKLEKELSNIMEG